MSEWIGHRAKEAVSALGETLKYCEDEISESHRTLDSYSIPRGETVGEYSRPYSLSERIDYLHNKMKLSKKEF